MTDILAKYKDNYDAYVDELWEKLLQNIREYNPSADFALLEKAYIFAKNAHNNQKRKSGEPFIIHPLEVAHILSENHADSLSLVVALLHDVVEDTQTTLETIRKQFGDFVADLVEGLTKTNKKYAELKTKQYSNEMFRKIMLAASKDIRVLLIKLADRLHNMRTLRYMEPEKQKEKAKETLEIFAPLAEKLGVWKIKSELEDLSLKYLEPEIYQVIKQRVAAKKGEREEKASTFVEDVKKLLKENKIEARVFGRAKHFYSIYRKMIRNGKAPENLNDLIGVRIVVKTIPDCYTVLSILQNNYDMIKEEFRDYLANPKPNGYQSIQTSFKKGKDDFEVQIRTEDMDLFAESGVAAHWRYKGESKDELFDNRIAFIRDILDMKKNDPDAEVMLDKVKFNITGNDIIVFTPEGDPIVLPHGSTPVDFAYSVHTHIGDHCSKAEVDDKIIPLDAELKSGDVVRIILQKNAQPSRQWLNFVRTASAKSKIRKALGMPEPSIKIPHGTENLLELLVISPPFDKYHTTFGKCCDTKYGIPIVGLAAKEKRLTIHTADCKNVKEHPKDMKIANVKWKDLKERRTKVRVVTADKLGILSELLAVFAHNNIMIHSINTEPRKGRAVFDFEVAGIHNEADLKNLFKNLKGLIDIFVDYSV